MQGAWCSSSLVVQVRAASGMEAHPQHMCQLHALYGCQSNELGLPICKIITSSSPPGLVFLMTGLPSLSLLHVPSPSSRICSQFPTLGIAAGYIFGGIVGLDYGWRIPFFIQVLPCPATARLVRPCACTTRCLGFSGCSNQPCRLQWPCRWCFSC